MYLDWEALARTNTHPLRVSILEAYCVGGGRTISPKELSLELDESLSNVNYHVTELFDAGLIEIDHERQVRGAMEHFYRPTNSDKPRRRGPKRRPKKRRRR